MDKKILYFPFFGLIYWLSGNIFIERCNKVKAMQSLLKAKDNMIKNNTSVWLFPEGTRDYGKGLQPFKTGVFYLARNAALPVIPVATSNNYPDFKFHRLNNSEMIMEFLPALSKENITSLPVKDIVTTFSETTNEKINGLDGIPEQLESTRLA